MIKITDAINGLAEISTSGVISNSLIEGILTRIQSLTSIVAMEKFREIRCIRGIVVVGSTAAGKTTLINQLREFSDVEIPRRFTTRPLRLNDDNTENHHVDEKTFEDKIKRKEIGIHWIRSMEQGRKVRYGFAVTSKGKLPLYSANNDFVRTLPDSGLLVLGVFAPDDIRAQRLTFRSPDMAEGERKHRLGDTSENIRPLSHLIVNNYNDYESRALSDVVELIKVLAKLYVPLGEIRDLGNYRTVAQTRLFQIVDHDVIFSDGTIKTFQYVERSPGARTLITDGQSLLLIKEWRQEEGCWDYRLPGGKLFETSKEYKSYKESPGADVKTIALAAARKEVYEECGLDLKGSRLTMDHLSRCGGVIEWDLYYFTARVKEKPKFCEKNITSEQEHICPEWLPFNQVRQLCLDGVIHEDRTVGFLLKFIIKNS